MHDARIRHGSFQMRFRVSGCPCQTSSLSRENSVRNKQLNLRRRKVTRWIRNTRKLALFYTGADRTCSRQKYHRRVKSARDNFSRSFYDLETRYQLTYKSVIDKFTPEYTSHFSEFIIIITQNSKFTEIYLFIYKLYGVSNIYTLTTCSYECLCFI